LNDESQRRLKKSDQFVIIVDFNFALHYTYQSCIFVKDAICLK